MKCSLGSCDFLEEISNDLVTGQQQIDLKKGSWAEDVAELLHLRIKL